MKFLLPQAILSCLALLATAQIQLCPHHEHLSEELRNCQGPELTNSEAFNTLSEFSKRYEQFCAHKMAPGMSVTELHVHRCADKQFNSMFYRCWADMLSTDSALNSAGVHSSDIALFKKSLDCQFHVLEIEV